MRIVKDHVDGRVLAIGDGANDVAMIQVRHPSSARCNHQEADVGVGLCGEEGAQASLAADFSV